jgi:hypothetical protein
MNLFGFAYSSKKNERTKHDVYVRRKIQAEKKGHVMTHSRKKNMNPKRQRKKLNFIFFYLGFCTKKKTLFGYFSCF